MVTGSDPFGELVAVMFTAWMSGLPLRVDGPQPGWGVLQVRYEPVVCPHKSAPVGIIARIANSEAVPLHRPTAPVEKFAQVSSPRQHMLQTNPVGVPPGPAREVRPELAGEFL
jgi:hypothetical protein